MKWGCVHENEGIQYCKLNQIAFPPPPLAKRLLKVAQTPNLAQFFAVFRQKVC